MKIYIQITNRLRDKNHNYEGVTIALYYYKDDLTITTTESWLQENCH